MVVLSLAREHVQVEEAHRLPRLRVGDGPELDAVGPGVGRLQLLELEPEDRLVDREHAAQHLLVREVDPERLGIDRVLLEDQLVLVVAPVRVVDLGVRVAGLLHLERAHLGDLGVELGLDALDQVLDELGRRGPVLRHLRLDPVVVPGGVAELERDRVPQGDNLVEEGDVLLLGQVVFGHDHLLAGLRHRAALLDHDALRRHVHEDRVLVVAGLDPRLCEEGLGNAGELSLRKDERGAGGDYVGLKVGLKGAQLLEEVLDLLALGRRQLEALAAVVAHRVLKKALVLARDGGLSVGDGLQDRVDVLPVPVSDLPLLHPLDLFVGGVAHGLAGARLLDEAEPALDEG